MTTIIIEDEKPAARLLLRKLEKIGVQVTTMLHSVEDAVAWFTANKHPDLIFLDIQLSDGLSFEIFDKITISSAVIFTTAYDEYALRAFKLNSIDYLLKPIDEAELNDAIAKYNSRITNNNSIDINAIKALLFNSSEKQFKNRFTVKVGQHLKVILNEEIECFYSENKGTYIHTIDNRDYLIDVTLEQLEQDLNPKLFYRISRKFIIPLQSVKEIQVYSNSRLKILLPSYKNEDVIVSREKVATFKLWME